jgi:hypothetical protein
MLQKVLEKNAYQMSIMMRKTWMMLIFRKGLKRKRKQSYLLQNL